jgi:uncharacterized protein (TIGR03437 family)
MPADVLFAGNAPGFVGLVQVNVRVPDGLAMAGSQRAPVVLTVGNQSSRPEVTIWVQ